MAKTEEEKAAARAAKEAEKEAARAAKEAEKAAATVDTATSGYDFEVGDPRELVPVTRPLVITPKGGEWDNEAQAEFARTLNGYAYKNPAKWEIKKKVLLDQLARLADHPEELLRVNGNPALSKVEFRNTAIKL